MSKQSAVNYIGNTLVALSFVFIVNRLIKYNLDLTGILTNCLLTTIAICTIVYSILVIAHAYTFCHILNLIHGTPLPQGNSVYTFCKTNLYKYLPGNIFHYVGRNKIAVDEQIPHSTVMIATFTDILFLVSAAVAVALVFTGQSTAFWFKQISNGHWTVITVILLIAVSVLVLILRRFTAALKSIIERVNLKDTVKVTGVYMLIFIFNGLILSWILREVGVDISKNVFIYKIIGAYSVSWIIGFLTPGAPGGIGVREAVISLLLKGSATSIDLIIIAVVITRIVSIMGDIMGVLIANRIRILKNQ